MKQYQAQRAAARAQAIAGRPRTGRGAGFYGSMPGMMIMLFPMNIQINPHEVVIMSANGGVREIYIDGRLHPKDPLPSTKGHSIGHWEGKVLVVDTCCMREDTQLPFGGPHSDAMQISERIWAPDDHTLKDAITVEDPKAFVKPWTTVKTYYRRPDWEQIEYDPDQNARDFSQADSGARPGNAIADAGASAAPLASPAASKPVSGAPLKPGDTEALQKATAFGVGNLAWETVSISDVQISRDNVKWLGTTRSAKWRCTAAPDGSKPYCER
jgi:hypothetical protein